MRNQERLVLFVCEHGSAKSVVAAAHFNRLARERRVGLRAVSRGTNPDDEIAPFAARGLEADNLAFGETPQRLLERDVEGAARIVAFCELPAVYGVSVPVEVWDDVPPVSEDYERARDAIVERVGGLLDQLAGPVRGAAGGPAL